MTNGREGHRLDSAQPFGPASVLMSHDGDGFARAAGRVAWTILRAAGSAAVLVALYYALPLDGASTPAAITMLLVGLAGFTALVTVQVWLIMRSPFPGLRAVESLATSIPFFLLLFAATYVVLAELSAANFGAHLSHTDGLYFTVTVFSTVGFGDITAKSETARLVVTGQMLADLIIYGLLLKVVSSAVRRRRQQIPPREIGQEPSDENS